MTTFDRVDVFAAYVRRAPTLRQHARWYPPSRLSTGAPRWPGVVATLVAAALLVAFVQVVRAGVDKGASRNRDVAARADRVWRCNIDPSANQRASCRAQLDAEVRAANNP